MKKLAFTIVLLCVIQFSFSQTGNHKAGVEALKDVTTGKFNTAVGDSTLHKLILANALTAFGYRAGYKAGTTTATERSTLLGFNAGANLVSATDNTFIGYATGYFQGTVANGGGDNTAVGSASGYHMNNDAVKNTFVGEMSGFGVVGGSNNTYLGHKAGAGSAFSSPLFDVTTGIMTTAQKAAVNATGYNNTGVGSEAIYSITTGFKNTALGNDAGYGLTSGSYNTFVGDSTGVKVNTAKYNTFIGQASGAATEKTNGNTFVGFRAGYDNNRFRSDATTSFAKENTYLGFRAGETNRKGSFNVMLGSRTDFLSNAQGSGNNYNVGIGYNVLFGGYGNFNRNGRNYSTAIGAFAKVNADYATAIGYNAEALLNNTMVLGGVSVTDRVTVGIGTKAPNRKASLDLADTDKGFLVNRLTNAQKTTLTSTLVATDIGMLIYDTDDKILYSWNGTAWDSSSTTALESRVSALETKASASALDKTPLLFNYQTAMLDINNEPLLNTNVSFRISIVRDTNTGTTVYQEIHSATTNTKGLTGFKIGNGTVVTGDLSTINWASALYFLKIEADIAGGVNYQDFGTSQFVSVPYAMHAKTADSLSSTTSSKMASKIASVVKENSNSELENLKNEVAELEAIIKKLQASYKTKK